MGKDIKTLHFKAGEVIFKEGDQGTNFYVVQRGEVEISVITDGEKNTIAKATQGEPFGEFAFISHKPRSATATASQDCTLIEISNVTYAQLLSEMPHWGKVMVESLIKKLIDSTELIKNSQSKNKELMNTLDLILED